MIKLRDMWCQDCKEVVEAKYYYEESTGFGEWQCPVDDFHTVDDIKECGCGGPMGRGDEFCPSCKMEIENGFAWFVKALPVGLDTTDVINYIVDTWTEE